MPQATTAAGAASDSTGNSGSSSSIADEALCDNCGNHIDACMCACPYCGQVDSCECCLYDAATGG